DVDGVKYTEDHILIATGGSTKRLDIPGAEYGIDSDVFFDLEELPESIAIIGGGYIGVEISGLLRTFGVESHVFEFLPSVLATFDSIIKEGYMESGEEEGVVDTIHTERNLQSVVE